MRFLKLNSVLGFVFLAVMGCFHSESAYALKTDKPLTLNDCKALEADKADYIHQGIERDIEKGPEWAKSNLPAERLREILRFIEIDELLKFRCYRVFAVAKREEQKKERQRARRLGVRIPPPPTRNPRRILGPDAAASRTAGQAVASHQIPLPGQK